MIDTVELGISRDVGLLLAHAQGEGRLVLVYGRAGSGKTTAARAYVRSRPADAWMCAMSPAVTTPAAVLGRVARVLDVGGDGLSAARLEAAVVRALLAADSPLLVVDEAHQLTHVLLDQLRCVHDETGCGLALVGNDPLWGRLSSGQRAEQLVSRVALRRRVGRPTDADAVAVAEAAIGADLDGAARAAVLKAARDVGGLRAVAMLARQAVLLARGDDRDPEPRDVADAARLQGAA